MRGHGRVCFGGAEARSNEHVRFLYETIAFKKRLYKRRRVVRGGGATFQELPAFRPMESTSLRFHVEDSATRQSETF